MIDSGRLKIGLSYDSHHLEGGLKKISIQKDKIEAISIAVQKEDTFDEEYFEQLERDFPNAKRILIDPFVSTNFDHCLTSWRDVKNVLIKFHKRFENLSCYAQIFSDCDFLKNSGYFEDAERDLSPYEKDSEWFISSEGFLANISKLHDLNHIRILTNGRVMEDLRLLDYSWNELNKKCKPIEDYFTRF